MLLLKEIEMCPFGNECPNIIDESSENNICLGLSPKRNTVFKCELVKENGHIEKLEFRGKKPKCRLKSDTLLSH